jgi:uncharacterized protein (DUF983 family)
MNNISSTWTLLLRVASKRCPHCGQGLLFKSYLTRCDKCDVCHEEFDGLDPEDGPAWLTIAVTAHIIIPLLIILENNAQLSYWAEGLILIIATIVSTLLILPISKGVFIAAMWLMKKNKI